MGGVLKILGLHFGCHFGCVNEALEYEVWQLNFNCIFSSFFSDTTVNLKASGVFIYASAVGDVDFKVPFTVFILSVRLTTTLIWRLTDFT